VDPVTGLPLVLLGLGIAATLGGGCWILGQRRGWTLGYRVGLEDTPRARQVARDLAWVDQLTDDQLEAGLRRFLAEDDR
jgi:hypothetical protein